MQYLIFDTLAEAQARSMEIWNEQSPPESDETKYYFGFIEHPDSLLTALIVPAGYESVLTAEEQAALKSESYMYDNGWFPNP